MTAALAGMELRLRARMVAAAAFGLVAVAALVGALFPSLGGSIGDLHLPDGVADLLGGGRLSTLAGWLRTEIAAVYGPLVFAGVAIAAAAATLAGEEEDRILALVLAHPVPRERLVLAKAAAIAGELGVLGITTLSGLVVARGLAGGGVSTGHLAALSLHLVVLGLAAGSLALALGAATGRRGISAGTAAAVLALMDILNGLAPLSDSTSWLRYASAFHYYADGDPLATGVHVGDLAVLVASSVALTALAARLLAGRDIRA